MARGKGRVQRKGRRFARRPRKFMSRIRKSLSGVAFTPRPDPPRWSLAPWNSITLVIASSGENSTNAVFKVSTVAQYLTEKYGLYVTSGSKKVSVDVALRFRTVRVFSREDFSPLLVKIHSIVGEDDLAILEDVPSKMRRARIGYRWPKSFSDVVYHKAVTVGVRDPWDDALFTIVMQNNASSFLVYVDLLWRPDCVNILQAKADTLFTFADVCSASSSFSDYHTIDN